MDVHNWTICKQPLHGRAQLLAAPSRRSVRLARSGTSQYGHSPWRNGKSPGGQRTAIRVDQVRSAEVQVPENMRAAEAELTEGREPRVADHALAHRDPLAVERRSLAAAQSRPGADKVPANVRAEQVDLAADRESVVQLKVSIDGQLRGPQPWQVTAGQPQCRYGRLGEVNRLLEPAAQQQQRARQPRRLQVQRPDNASSRQARP